jgi:hypothetical protein
LGLENGSFDLGADFVGGGIYCIKVEDGAAGCT